MLDYAASFAFFHINAWPDARAGVDRGDLTFGQWVHDVNAMHKQARHEARQRSGDR